jgi:hypothetical protein
LPANLNYLTTMSALHKSPLFPAELTTPAASKKRVQPRDILWGQPVFKAPELPNPRVQFDPLPFTAVRITQPGALSTKAD